MAATKAKPEPKPPPRCGPYSTPIWDAEAGKWDRRLTDAGRELAAAYLERYPSPVALVTHTFPHLLTACRQLGVTDDEINQVGRIAVLKAVSLFDPTREISLTTYVTWWVRGRVTDLLPTRRAAPRLRQHQFGRDREYDEFVSGGVVRAGDVPDHRAADPADAAAAADLRRELAGLLRHLPRAQRLAVVAWANGHTLREVAAVLGVTGERVRQLRRKGLDRLRKAAGVGR